MSLFYLVEKHYGIRFSPYRLCELSALLVSYISGRRSYQSRYGEFLHIFAHIDTYHVVFVVEQTLCQSFCKLCFADTGRSQKQERADRLAGILYSGFRTYYRIRNLCYSLVLTYYTFMQCALERKYFCSFSLGKLSNRYSRPTRYNRSNLFLADTLMHKRKILALYFILLLLQLILKLRQLTILQLRRLIEVVILLCRLNLSIYLFDFFP